MVNIILILLGTTILYAFAAGRIDAYIKTLSVQGFLLFLLVLADAQHVNFLNFAFLIFETLIIKAIFIPYFLLQVLRRNEISREIDPYISQFYSLLIAVGVFIFGFVVAYWSASIETGILPLYFGVSVSLIISALILIVVRKRIITHILCYMMLENGIFLLSLSVAGEMPLLVNMGVLLDLFVGVYLLVIFFNQIQKIFDGSHIDVLTELRD
ncbi:MAG: hypothetical protein ONA69_05210 [candidate division KSB1 bacterium]|nr:hypothetical protein [candidate division KSB1 bacterium]MDZ7346177.1 hypothetical protein [candidate division KSB1 bacterium]